MECIYISKDGRNEVYRFEDKIYKYSKYPSSEYTILKYLNEKDPSLHVPTVLDYRENLNSPNGTKSMYVIVMTYIKPIHDTPLRRDTPLCRELAIFLIEIYQRLHDLNVCHRDGHINNIICSEDGYYLIDFETSEFLHESPRDGTFRDGITCDNFSIIDIAGLDSAGDWWQQISSKELLPYLDNPSLLAT